MRSPRHLENAVVGEEAHHRIDVVRVVRLQQTLEGRSIDPLRNLSRSVPILAATPWIDKLTATSLDFQRCCFDRPMKNKGLGERFGRNLRSFWVTRRSLGDRGGPWSGSCEVDVAAVGRDRRDRGRFLRADDPRRGCRRRQLALGCARARADDVSKSRRQELVVCRATCVLLVSDLIYARSSVTLAPAFLAGAPASWSWTSRK